MPCLSTALPLTLEIAALRGYGAQGKENCVSYSHRTVTLVGPRRLLASLAEPLTSQTASVMVNVIPADAKKSQRGLSYVPAPRFDSVSYLDYSGAEAEGGSGHATWPWGNTLPLSLKRNSDMSRALAHVGGSRLPQVLLDSRDPGQPQFE
jgi:hypothetical protein